MFVTSVDLLATVVWSVKYLSWSIFFVPEIGIIMIWIRAVFICNDNFKDYENLASGPMPKINRSLKSVIVRPEDIDNVGTHAIVNECVI